MSVEAKTIEGINLKERWGIDAKEYWVSGISVPLDFQDVMVQVSEQRATAVEKEVAPLASRIKARNKRLETAGTALSALSKLTFDTSKDANPTSGNTTSFTKEEYGLLKEIDCWPFSDANYSVERQWSKDKCDYAKRMVQTEIDKLNNESQLDMNRMQSLVDHRDQSFNTATTMMQHISETRGTTIKGMS